MKRIITCILAITFLFILFFAPIYIPNEEFLVDITSAYLKNGYDDEYLTEEEIMLMEKWLPSLHSRAIGIEFDEPMADYITLRVETEKNTLIMSIPALYRMDSPVFDAPVSISGHFPYYFSQNQSLTWEVYDMLREVDARRADNFKKLLESKRAAN